MANFKAAIRQKIEGARADYAKDLAATPHDVLDASPGVRPGRRTISRTKR